MCDLLEMETNASTAKSSPTDGASPTNSTSLNNNSSSAAGKISPMTGLASILARELKSSNDGKLVQIVTSSHIFAHYK
jgi:hypothetical protein